MPIVETSTDPARPVEVVLMDEGIEADATVAPAGKVRFSIVNRGQQEHGLVLVRTDDALEDLPVREARVDERRVQVVGRVSTVETEGSGDAVFDLAPGRYVLFSNGSGDYERGMRAELTVQPPEPFDQEHYERGTAGAPASER